MATKRTRRGRGFRGNVAEWKIKYFYDGEYQHGSWEFFGWDCPHEYEGSEILKDWHAVREGLVAAWTKEKPGTRPWAWWEFESPEPRKRLGGIGTPEHEVTALSPSFKFGIPRRYVSPDQVEYYNGRAKDIHGNPIGEEYKEGDFPYDAYDPEDPPTYESEAAYLKRHGLLTEYEIKILTPEAFQEVFVDE